MLTIQQLQDHPRLRGEKEMSLKHFCSSMGSPPLTRGKVSRPISRKVALGITPAYAGKRRRRIYRYTRRWDHPRLRGEKSPAPSAGRSLLGSPPLTRGKVCQHTGGGELQRITPAYAGKSAQDHHTKVCETDHPRLRGEKPLSA